MTLIGMINSIKEFHKKEQIETLPEENVDNTSRQVEIIKKKMGRPRKPEGEKKVYIPRPRVPREVPPPRPPMKPGQKVGSIIGYKENGTHHTGSKDPNYCKDYLQANSICMENRNVHFCWMEMLML